MTRIEVKAGENGKLFGGVSAKEIAETLEKQHKIKIDKKKIDLKENMEVTILSFKGKVFAVEPPIFVELEVVYTEPGFAGNTTTTSGKPAKLETGLELQVPMFVNIGDILRIDTRTCEYMERV